MKTIQKLMVVISTLALSMLLSVTVLAATAFSSPAEVVATITGKSVEEVIDQRAETGKTYGTIAKEAGKLEEFKEEMLKVRIDSLTQQVKNGELTQEQADEIIASVKEAQALCDGTGNGGLGQGRRGGQGSGMGNCAGNGTGRGAGKGAGRGICRF